MEGRNQPGVTDRIVDKNIKKLLRYTTEKKMNVIRRRRKKKVLIK